MNFVFENIELVLPLHHSIDQPSTDTGQSSTARFLRLFRLLSWQRRWYLSTRFRRWKVHTPKETKVIRKGRVDRWHPFPKGLGDVKETPEKEPG